MAFPAEFNLADLDGSNGFVIRGEGNIGFSGGSLSGYSVSSAGDINGDGFDDVIIGAPEYDAFSVFSGFIIPVGKSYVVFGSDESFPSVLELSSLDGSNGFGIEPNTYIDRLGQSVSGVGDINGDGFDDVIIGAPYPRDTSNRGRTYIIFGNNGGFPSNILSSSNSQVFGGLYDGDLFGFSVSGAGDVNGDGFDDVIIGAPEAGTSREGNSVLAFGNRTGTDFTFTTFVGIDENDFLGGSVSGAGDVNGDGIDDLIIGADEAETDTSNQGQTYVVFGNSAGFGAEFDLTSLNGRNGFVIRGIDEDDYSGFSVSDAGDINGDGFDDLIIGALRAEANKTSQGESYVVFGKSRRFAAELDLANLNGRNGFVIRGIDEYDFSGISVSGAGDVNGDGFDDLIIGASGADADVNNQGESYVVFGSSEGFSAELKLKNLDGDNGFVIRGIDENDFSGRAVSGAGDVNGDGIDDIIIGALRAEAGASSSDDRGESYVIFGVASETVVSGTSNNDLLNGSSQDESIFGLAGNDTINGRGGDDVLRGNKGRDRLSGGTGNDTLNGNNGSDRLSGQAGNDTVNGDNGNDRLSGNNGSDRLFGQSGNDTLNGNKGRDRLSGGAGNDTLTGGNNADRFIFDTGRAFNSSNLGIDRITDFAIDLDKIIISQDTFTRLDNNSNGRLRNSDFAVVTSNTQARISNAEIVYNSGNGRLFYNANNDLPGFGNGGLFAILEGSPDNLSNSDFDVVDV